MKEIEELLGSELFNQVKEKIGNHTLIINDGSYIPKKKFDDLNNDKKALQTQLEEANKKISTLSQVDTADLQKEIDDWKNKYETETKELNDKISKREYEYVVNDLVRDIKFSSSSAKKNFIRELQEKELKLENGKLLGFDDYKKEYEEKDPGAFLIEDKKQGQQVDLGGNHVDQQNLDPSQMSYEEYKKWRKES